MSFDFHLELDPPQAGKPQRRFPSGFTMRNARRWFRIIGSLVAINLVCAPETRLHAQGAPPADRGDPVTPRAARYVRLVVSAPANTSMSGSTTARIYELEVYGG